MNLYTCSISLCFFLINYFGQIFIIFITKYLASHNFYKFGNQIYKAVMPFMDIKFVDIFAYFEINLFTFYYTVYQLS